MLLQISITLRFCSRLTEAVNRDLFCYIDDVYSSTSFDSGNSSSSLSCSHETDVSHVNLTDFVLGSAHQREDFFDR